MKVKHHNFTSSDHCRISVSLILSQVRKAPPFRFNKLWTTRKDFDCLIKRTWSTRFQGSHMFCFTRKCKPLKEKAKLWSTTRFGNIFRQLRVVEEKLKIIQERLIVEGDCMRPIEMQGKFSVKQSKLLLFQDIHWKTKAKSNHLKLSNENTSYYHACATIRKNRNLIKSIQDAQNNSITHPARIEECITNAFRQ